MKDGFQRRRRYDPMKVASTTYSWPEKLTTWQAPRSNCAHPLAAFASASACKDILKFEEQEPSAVKPIAPHGMSVEAAFGWLGRDAGIGAGLGATQSVLGRAGIGAGAGRLGAAGGGGSGDPIDVCAMANPSSGRDNISEPSACRAGAAAIGEVVIALANDNAMGRTARIVQVNFKSTSGLSSVSRDRNVPRIPAHHKRWKPRLPWIFDQEVRVLLASFLTVQGCRAHVWIRPNPAD